MRLYRLALILLIFLFVFLITVNVYKYYELKVQNDQLKKTYEKLQREYSELKGLERRLQEMKKSGEVRGDNVP